MARSNFATRISIAPDMTYVAADYSPNGLTGNTPPPRLKRTAPASSLLGGNGDYNYKQAFPKQAWENSNSSVDVVFVPTAPAPYLVLSFNPPNPSISGTAPLGSQVATISSGWSDGSPVTGTLSFGPPHSDDSATFALACNNLIINPSGPSVSADGNTLQPVTIVVTQ